MNKLFLIIGRTAVGKTSLAKQAAKELNLKIVKSYTTRPQRANEVEEVSDHYFINESDVKKYKNDIVAYTEINGYKYFATKNEVEKSDLYVIDPDGIKYLKKNFDKDFVEIYIRVPFSTGKQRAKNRKDNKYEERYKKENEQFSEYEKRAEYHYQILNDGTFEEGVNKLIRIIKKEIEKDE